MASGISREELEQAFRSDPKYGMECLHSFFQEEIAGYIKCAGHGALDDNDIADIYQDVLVEMIEACRKPTFDPAEPMRLVYRIVYTNTKDYLRRRGIRSAATLDDCLEFLAADFKDTNVQLRWKYMTESQKADFNNALFEIVDELPDKQRNTAIVFITRFKETRETDLFTAVAEGVREYTKEDVTTAAVKRNWYRARTKVAEKLVERGFDVFSPE